MGNTRILRLLVDLCRRKTDRLRMVQWSALRAACYRGRRVRTPRPFSESRGELFSPLCMVPRQKVHLDSLLRQRQDKSDCPGFLKRRLGAHAEELGLAMAQ